MTHSHSPDPARLALRQDVRTVACPFCGVPAGQKCLGVALVDGRRKVRGASHAERWDAHKRVTHAELGLEAPAAVPRDPRSIACPQCGATAGEQCLSKTSRPTVPPRRRIGCHQARWSAYRSLAPTLTV